MERMVIRILIEVEWAIFQRFIVEEEEAWLGMIFRHFPNLKNRLDLEEGSFDAEAVLRLLGEFLRMVREEVLSGKLAPSQVSNVLESLSFQSPSGFRK
ncbi:MAG TPA: hypothetical protein VJB99_01750 [Patescibacteria group bacterium]|nr:hypothetical protein [Patescibacteria group bacterium]